MQEIDIATGKVIWEWHALGHVPVNDSYEPYVAGQRYDYFHLNSIQQLPDGNILISSRDSWTVYLIDKATGNIIWQLGGKDSASRSEPRQLRVAARRHPPKKRPAADRLRRRQ